jgi:hypothetical protein
VFVSRASLENPETVMLRVSGDLQEGDVLAGDPGVPSRGSHLRGRQGNNPPVRKNRFIPVPYLLLASLGIAFLFS